MSPMLKSKFERCGASSASRSGSGACGRPAKNGCVMSGRVELVCVCVRMCAYFCVCACVYPCVPLLGRATGSV